MTIDDTHKQEELQRLSGELDRLKGTLEALRSDSARIEASKFAQLRALWLATKQLFFRKGQLSPSKSALQATDLHTNGLPNSTDFGRIQEALIAKLKPIQLGEEPLVSVIIPVFDHCAVTLRCLAALAATWSSTIATEVIVVDDGSSDQTHEMLSPIPGVILLRNLQNRGFVDACNRAASVARGRYLCFLNNDTEVQNAWLDRLVSCAERSPSIGAVGSMLLYPDGSLQEAGGIIWRDGHGYNYGRGANAGDARYNFAREVDYCSGASLLVRADAFRRARGFSTEYAPAYYEDVDLCFRLRHLGYSVNYEPKSRVVHYEGTTSGIDLKQGAKRFQELNRAKFVDRWQAELKTHPEFALGREHDAARASSRFSVLFVDAHVPTHDRDAGSKRMFEILKMLSSNGCRVIFLPDNNAAAEPYTSDLQELGIEVIYGSSSDDAKVRARFAAARAEAIWISRPNIFEKWAPIFRDVSRGKLIYDTVDLHYVRARREEALRKPADSTWEDLKHIELRCATSADATVVTTLEEKLLLERDDIENIFVVPTIHTIQPSSRPFDETSGILFIGSYKHPPNVDAATWLCTEIMPLLWRELPTLRLTLLGSDPPASVSRLRSDRVFVPGYVRDVSSYFLTHRVFVAPLRYGAGQKGKIGESLSYGLPVVTNAVGAEGYGLVDGVNAMIAEGLEDLAAAILRVYNDADLWETLSRNSARSLSRFSPLATRDELLRAVGVPSRNAGLALAT